jgi:hypothetical protein
MNRKRPLNEEPDFLNLFGYYDSTIIPEYLRLHKTPTDILLEVRNQLAHYDFDAFNFVVVISTRRRDRSGTSESYYIHVAVFAFTKGVELQSLAREAEVQLIVTNHNDKQYRIAMDKKLGEKKIRGVLALAFYVAYLEAKNYIATSMRNTLSPDIVYTTDKYNNDPNDNISIFEKGLQMHEGRLRRFKRKAHIDFIDPDSRWKQNNYKKSGLGIVEDLQHHLQEVFSSSRFFIIRRDKTAPFDDRRQMNLLQENSEFMRRLRNSATAAFR